MLVEEGSISEIIISKREEKGSWNSRLPKRSRRRGSNQILAGRWRGIGGGHQGQAATQSIEHKLPIQLIHRSYIKSFSF